MTVASPIYIVRIEGVGVVVGGVPTQMSYCYPVLPSFADASYLAGLVGPPSGVASRWDVLEHTASVGRFTLQFRPDLEGDPLEWFQTRPIPVSECRKRMNTSDTALIHAKHNDDAGLNTGVLAYLDRETVHVTNGAAGSYTATIARGVCGSTAERHDTEDTSPIDAGSDFFAGSDIYLQPPALTGRLVEVYEIDRDATSGPTSNDIILRGYISGEVAGGLHWAGIECVERFVGDVNGEPRFMRAMIFSTLPDGTPSDGRFECRAEGGGKVYPIGAAAGGHLWLPDLGALYRAAWTDPGSSGQSGWTLDGVDWQRPVFLEGAAPNFVDLLADTWGYRTNAYRVLFSDADQGTDYAPFQRYIGGAWVTDDHPITIVLNMLLSLDGSNYDVGDFARYDRGAHVDADSGEPVAGGLYPSFSLGVPRDQVDLAAFEAARDELAGVRAKRLYLGGSSPEALRDVFRALLAPYGYTVATTRKGIWKPLRLGDVYGTPDLELTSAHLVKPEEWQVQTLARPLDRVVLELEPGPDGLPGTYSVTVKEVTRRRFYPQHVGNAELIQRAPYAAEDWGPTGFSYGWAAERVRRLSERVGFLTVFVGPSAFDQVEVGDTVSVADKGIRNPVTGARWTSGAGIVGRCVGVDPNWRTRVSRLVLAVTDTPKVGRYAPCALLNGGGQNTTTFTVHEHEFTRADEDEDAKHFAAGAAGVGDIVVLLNKRLVLRSDPGQGVRVVAVTGTTLEVSERFKDRYGVATLTGDDADVITFAAYDYVNASQRTDTAYRGAGGAPGSEVPNVGSADDDPYVWGD